MHNPNSKYKYIYCSYSSTYNNRDTLTLSISDKVCFAWGKLEDVVLTFIWFVSPGNYIVNSCTTMRIIPILRNHIELNWPPHIVELFSY
jgi:hypothetical protein